VAELGGANQRNHSRAMERILRVKEIENLGLQDIHLLQNIVGSSCNLIMHLSFVDVERWNCLVKTTEQFQEITKSICPLFYAINLQNCTARKKNGKTL
jgi:hypothetical protein